MQHDNPITEEELRLVALLKHEPGYILLCDHLQAYVDDMADGMGEDGLTSDERLQRVHEWRAARKLLAVLKTYPETIGKDIEEVKGPNKAPEELTIDPLYLARMKASLQFENVEE